MVAFRRKIKKSIDANVAIMGRKRKVAASTPAEKISTIKSDILKAAKLSKTGNRDTDTATKRTGNTRRAVLLVSDRKNHASLSRHPIRNFERHGALEYSTVTGLRVRVKGL
jgi:hypothetical protein